MKISTIYIIGVLLLLDASFESVYGAQVCPTPIPQEYEHIQPGKQISAFFGGWERYKSGHSVADIARVADKIDVLYYAFAVPDVKTGGVKLHDPHGDISNFQALKELKKQFPHLKILLSFGGGKVNKDFMTIANTFSMHALAKSMVDLLYRYEQTFTSSKTGQQEIFVHEYFNLFDGIDLDWEFVPSKMHEKYAVKWLELLTQLRKLLGKERLLTADLQVSPEVYKKLPLAKAAKLVDWYNVMLYDFSTSYNPTVGHNSPSCGAGPYTFDGALSRLMKQGVPPNKLVAVLAGYYHVYENTNGVGQSFKNEKKGTTVPFRTVEREFATNPNVVRLWDEKAKASVLHNHVEKKVLTGDDINSIEYKMFLIQHDRLRGAGLWTLAMDDEDNSIINTMYNAYV